MLPWTDRSGRFAPFRALVFLLVLAPGLWLALEAANNWLGPRALIAANHQAGLWAIRLLALSLAITPLRVASRFARLAGIRRMIGVSVLAYALLHVALYIVDQHFALGRIVWEIATRIYLLIGFIALCGLIALGATSTDGMVRRLGSDAWTRLHRLAYPIAALGAVHFFMQSKLDETQPFIIGGIVALLLLARPLRTWRGDLSLIGLALLAIGTAGSTALAEAGWYAFKTGAPFTLILSANLDFSYTIRPAWYVLGCGLILLLARLSRPLFVRKPRRADADAEPRYAASSP